MFANTFNLNHLSRPTTPSILLHRVLLLLLAVLLGFFLPWAVHAETKMLTAEATYIMGDDRESPSFAEAMVLQKAKQLALEQAGTYVESYTKARNYDLTTEEIQTIAGGIMQVEVLDKRRTLVTDGLRFYIKIKAIVTTDKMEELVQRIKGKNVAEEHKKLQDENARLIREIENLKQQLDRTPSPLDREALNDQLRQRQKSLYVETNTMPEQTSEAVPFYDALSDEQWRETVDRCWNGCGPKLIPDRQAMRNDGESQRQSEGRRPSTNFYDELTTQEWSERVRRCWEGC